MRKHRPSSNMMEESEYFGDEEPLFTFDNDQDEAAAMDQFLDHVDHMQLHDDDDMADREPLTPYGSAEASAPPAVHQASAAAGPGRFHLSSANAWQNPAHMSPPALSHSPSPRTPATFQHQHQHHQHRPPQSSHDPRAASSRYLSRRNSIQYSQHQDRPDAQPSRQNPGQAAYSPIDATSRRRQAPQPPNSSYDNYDKPSQPYEASPRPVPSVESHDDEEPDLLDLDPAPKPKSSAHPPPDQDQEYVMIPADELDAMFNGNEESRITAQKFKDQVINATVQNGRVVYMVGQATVEWWMSPDMQKRRRAAGRKLLDVGGAVVSGAGSVIMSSTPLGRVCDSVSTNVTAFKAAPFSYTMQGLGIMKKNPVATLAPTASYDRRPENPLVGSKCTTLEPAIADEDAVIGDWDDDADDEFDGGMGMGMGMGLFEEDFESNDADANHSF